MPLSVNLSMDFSDVKPAINTISDNTKNMMVDAIPPVDSTVYIETWEECITGTVTAIHTMMITAGPSYFNKGFMLSDEVADIMIKVKVTEYRKKNR